ncbi:acid-soluble spore protein SspC [Ectobacillus funiculus]
MQRHTTVSGNSSNELLFAAAQSSIDQMKLEIAREFGIQLGPETTSRANGSVGGEITKTPCYDSTAATCRRKPSSLK